MHFSNQILEFDKVKALIVDKAHTVLGKKLSMEITPTNNRLEIERKLKETSHALDILNGFQEPPFGGIRNLKETLKKAHIYSVLRPTEFLDVVALIDAINNNIRFYKQVKEKEIDGEALDEHFYNLASVPNLKRAIESVITGDGNIYDNASHDLLKIRNKITRNQNKITERLNNILSTQKSKLTETLITIRSNRFVVPVKLSEKNNFQGSIIDYSSSGETVYMEPSTITVLNNEITMMKLDEQKEMEKILRDLTIQVAEHYHPLNGNLDILTELDVIFAKAKFGLLYECTMPIITEEDISLVKARHPLINQKDVVANTITFGKKEKIIVITGPNTGGKTVALKTMGLLSIMVQSGILIPVNEGSKTVIFENVFADIGDEQSIEQSLSTFSSHMTRIISILENLTVGSLILLDELGSGTDPKEGASLAISILDHIRIRGVYVIATTHYPELKAYAYNKEEIINASVEFDVDSLSPTYRLMLGTPGKSNALLISERLGLDSRIINAAKENVLTSKSEISDLINKLERQGNLLDTKIQEYETMISASKLLVKENEELRKDLLEKQRVVSRKSSVEKSQLIKSAKSEALELIKEIEALKSSGNIKANKKVEIKYKEKNFGTEESAKSTTKDHIYEPGDIVNVLMFNRTAELIKKQKNNKWIVKMGSLTSQYAEDQFEFVESKVIDQKPKGQMKSMVKKFVKSELDLRGMRYEEAYASLDKYVDDCVVSNMPFAQIIHGYGTLTIRKLVKEYVSKHRSIERHRDGEGSEGGNGVTVIYFK